IGADFNHEIGLGHLSPELGFHEITCEVGGHRCEGVHDKEMSADMRGVPVVLMREQNDARLLRLENIHNDFDTLAPVIGLPLASMRIDFVEAIWSGREQAKTNIITGILQFAETFGLALLFAALRHCYVEQIHPGFPEQAQRKTADNA